MPIRFSADRPLTDAEEAEIQRMIASDPDNPEITKEQMAHAKTFHEVFPELAAKMKKELARQAHMPKDGPDE